MNSGLLKVSGSDAKKLLQGQLTCDVNDVTSTQLQLGAHCNPQGRIISLFRLFIYQDDYYLLMPKSMVAIALAALKKYAVFFKVELTDVSDYSRVIPAQAGIHSEWIPACAGMTQNAEITAKDLDLMNIKLGLAMIYPETSGVFLPHEINLPQLNGVSFNKGCYTGQEIIARMHYRGKLKNQLHLATCESETFIRGNDIFDKNGIAGKVVDYVGNTLLILTRDTSQPLFIDEARTQPIQVNHVY